MTLRELKQMADARLKSEWRRTAALMAHTANLMRQKNTAALSIDDFDPFAAPREGGLWSALAKIGGASAAHPS